MQKSIKTILILLLIFESFNSYSKETDSLKTMSAFNVGLNFNCLLHLPFLSIEYRINDKYTIALEGRPQNIFKKREPGKWIEYADNSTNFSRIIWEDSKMKGFTSNLVFHFLGRKEKKIDLSHAIEFAYSYKYLDYYRLTSLTKPSSYYFLYSKYSFSLNYLLSYNIPIFRFYIGGGISYYRDYHRGYNTGSERIKIFDYTDSNIRHIIQPDVGINKYLYPTFRLGVRMSINDAINKVRTHFHQKQ